MAQSRSNVFSPHPDFTMGSFGDFFNQDNINYMNSVHGSRSFNGNSFKDPQQKFPESKNYGSQIIGPYSDKIPKYSQNNLYYIIERQEPKDNRDSLMAKDDNSMPIKTSGYPLNTSSDNFSNGGDSETYRKSLPYQMPSLFKNNPLNK